jgi:hypothetical protein
MAVTFRSELDITPIGPGRWKLRAPLEAQTEFGLIVVPAGFVTDGASVPRFLWPLYPPMDGDYDAAAVLHDYAYQHSQIDLARQLAGRVLTRAEADSLLSEGMVATNTAKRKRLAIYVGVRVGGKPAWNADRKKELAGR